MGSVSISSDQIKIPSNYEISNEADIDYLQENTTTCIKTCILKRQIPGNTKSYVIPNIDYLNQTYRSEERYHVSLHVMNLFQKHYQVFI